MIVVWPIQSPKCGGANALLCINDIWTSNKQQTKWEMLLIINECQEKTSCIDSHIVIKYIDLL